MNQADYKVIAEIISKYQIEGYNGLVKDLADYFENEGHFYLRGYGCGNKFDKKQFLKDCGVEV